MKLMNEIGELFVRCLECCSHLNIIMVISNVHLRSPAIRMIFQELDEANSKNQNLHYWPFVKGIHQWPVGSPHKAPVMQKEFPFHDIIMILICDFLWSESLMYRMVPQLHNFLLSLDMGCLFLVQVMISEIATALFFGFLNLAVKQKYSGSNPSLTLQLP